ncbi:hypothetical protein [Bailinhaonella thermotolerans]|uniref:Uncharacterized protein n=1 Tax=Bailinhaonella thermotolerans TaxID=1070861 RepID=A0A3A4B9G2_9ACTN|nr:hypothetical protein [Bailinhaonella thermotolerans]RJL35529.1 hypothetical protein D5H75_01650 [Bailinhaonella thermotolerans]
MSPAEAAEHRLVVLADHYQFYLQDLGAHGEWTRSWSARGGPPPRAWGDESGARRIVAEPYSITVGTARSDLVEVLLRVRPDRPAADLEAAEHVVEADLDLPGGELAVYGPADDPGDERRLTLTPGRYRVRVSYLPSGPPGEGAAEHEPGDHFRYRADLWPTRREGAPDVLKQGPVPWAG